MRTTRIARRLPLVMTAFAALLGALFALAVSNGHDAYAHDETARHASAVAHGQAITRTELELRNGMRELWEDHIVWTRLAIISLTTGSPDTQATVARLLKNQTEIGNAVKPFYGKSAGNKLTAELRRHIVIAADVVGAAKGGDRAALADAQERWQRNADDIAGVLASVNPRYWKLSVMKSELRKHLALTTDEAVARLQGAWARDVAAYDKIHHHALHMADLLSAGLVKQFPKRFR